MYDFTLVQFKKASLVYINMFSCLSQQPDWKWLPSCVFERLMRFIKGDNHKRVYIPYLVLVCTCEQFPCNVMLNYLRLYCFTKVGKLQLSLLLSILLSEAHISSERGNAVKILFTHRILSRRCCQSSHHSCHTPGSRRYSDHSHIWTPPGGRWVLACGTCAPAHRTHPRSRCRRRRQSHVTHSGRSGRWTDVAGKVGTCSPAHRCCLHSRYDGRTWFEEQRKWTQISSQTHHRWYPSVPSNL